MTVRYEKKSNGGDLTMRKSDRVRVQHEKRRDGVRLYHKRKSDGVRVHHEKERWVDSSP